MSKILLDGYSQYYKEEIEYIEKQAENIPALEMHLEKIEKEIKKYSIMYKLEIMILKLIPLLLILLYMFIPDSFLLVLSIATALAFVVEGIITSFFPRTLYSKLIKNSTIITNMITLLKNR